MLRHIHDSIAQFAAVALLIAGAASLPAQTSIQASPSSLTFSALTGSTAAQSQSLVLSAPGASSAVSYTLGSNSAWLTVSPSTGTISASSPVTVTVTANPAVVAAGSYNGTLNVAANGILSTTVNVAFTVGPLSVSPTTIAFNYTLGSSIPAPQTMTVSAATATAFTVSLNTSSGGTSGNWLQAAPTSGTAAPTATVAVSVNPAVLANLLPGSYNGTVTVTPTAGGPAVQVPAALTVSAMPQLTATPSSLSFNYQIGGINNVVQLPVGLKSSGAPLSYSVTTSGQPWLTVSPTSGDTTVSPTLTVTIAPQALTPATYTASITVTAPGASNSPVTIPVNVVVSNTPLLSVSPASLTFNWQTGTPSPAAQVISPASTGTPITYTATSDSPWLTVTPPATPSTPNQVNVTVNPAGLAPAIYNGNVIITPAGGSPVKVPVTFTITNDPIPLISGQSTAPPVVLNYQLGQTPPAAQTVNITSSTGATLNFAATAATTTGGNWLSVTPGTGTTPGTLTVSAATAGVAAGTYDGDITVTATNPATGKPAPVNATEHVKYYISNNALLNVNTNNSTPNLLSFTYVSNGASPAPQSIAVTSTNPAATPLQYSATFTTSSSIPWASLTIGSASGSSVPVPGTTPTPISVSIQQLQFLTAGTYTGTISITATDPATGAAVPNSPQSVSVQLLVAAGTLAASPTSLTFSQNVGGSAPAAQTITLTGPAVAFTASASTQWPVPWLKVTPASGTLPSSLSVSADATNLSAGTYQGTVTIVAPGAAGSPFSIPVTFTVNAPPTLTATPASLSFTVQAGGQAPAAQTIQVSSSSPANFTVTTTTSNNGSWLKVTPASGSTTGSAPVALTVAIDPAGLPAGNYTGTISVAATGASGSPPTVNVTLAVQGLPAPAVVGARNGASFALATSVSPGEIISIYGSNMGPTTITGLQVTTAGMVATTLSDTQVLFDNIAAPLIAVSDTQINLVVPYEVAGRQTTNVIVRYKGQASAAFSLPVTDAVPGIFTLNMAGSGPGAILNQDFSVNAASNPAQRGSAVMIYATGEGQTLPPGVTGRVTGNLLSKPILEVQVLIGGKVAKLDYAGSAPALVAGVLQVNAEIPADAPSGPSVPVIIIVGSASSQANVTLAIQ